MTTRARGSSSPDSGGGLEALGYTCGLYHYLYDATGRLNPPPPRIDGRDH